MKKQLVALAWLACCCMSASVFGQISVEDHWQYTLTKPEETWIKTDFDDSLWKQGDGGFGTKGTPNARIGTIWKTPDIWLRKTFSVDNVPEQCALLMHHDEDVEVYLNGAILQSQRGYTTEYKLFPLGSEQRSMLKKGKNQLSVHCHQTGGGQFIDVHVVDAKNVPDLPRPASATVPFKTDLITSWGSELQADHVWTEYPRPQLQRDSWTNLNGQWDYAVTPASEAQAPKQWAGKLLVPFSLESKLGGVGRLLGNNEALWYHRTFEASPSKSGRTLLNFEAVDYQCQAFVNGKSVGQHQGGNTPFSFDITNAVREGNNELVLRVEDDTMAWQLHGKQHLDPSGIWYTQVSGIWQTVWLENVSQTYIEDLTIHTDAKTGTIHVRPDLVGNPAGHSFRVLVRDGDQVVAETKNVTGEADIKIENAKLWSPTLPHLYDLEVQLFDDQGKAIDRVQSYAGIRTIGKTADADGHLRFTLNDEVIFHWGPLDQGWWPDGLLTPPSDDAMKFDIEFLKSAGFNMIRKHIKVEPRRYYYHCDRLGMMVWQDQVSGSHNPPWTHLATNPVDAEWPNEAHEQFMVELERMIDNLESNPCIVVWVPFNEAWGQHRTVEVGQWVKKRDPSRLVNIASGGNFWPVGDIVDEHSYPHPAFPFDADRYKGFIHVVGEFGGHGYPVTGHLWDTEANNWGYGGLPKNEAEYRQRYEQSIDKLKDLKKQGIAGGVYTQTTDVEGEINGLVTYDRKVIKIPAKELKRLHEPLTATTP